MVYDIVIFGRTIPIYGLCIVIGVLLTGLATYILNRKHKGVFDEMILIYAYGGMFAALGAKVLFLFTVRDLVDWSRIFELEYFNILMTGGFVFYGGLVGGIFGSILACRIHKIDWKKQLPIALTAVPLAHACGRMGCGLVGCCYGMEYCGLFNIVYTHSLYAPNNVSLLPTQFIEVGFNLILFVILFYFSYKKLDLDRTIAMYFPVYAVYRFIMEFFRADAERGAWLAFSTSQWISIVLLVITLVYIIYRKWMKKEIKTI